MTSKNYRVYIPQPQKLGELPLNLNTHNCIVSKNKLFFHIVITSENEPLKGVEIAKIKNNKITLLGYTDNRGYFRKVFRDFKDDTISIHYFSYIRQFIIFGKE